jgi:hypothetical protein
MKVTHVVDREEVLMLIDLIEASFVPGEIKLRSVKRLEHITGIDIPGTKMFRKIRDAYLSGKENELATPDEIPAKRCRKPVAARTRAGQGVGKGGGRHT